MRTSKKQDLKRQERIFSKIDWNLEDEAKDNMLSLVINRGIEAYLEDIEKEIRQICGERYKHQTGREFTRWSLTETPLIMGGRKVSITYPRVRNLDSKKEQLLETVIKFKDREILSKRQMEQMIIGVSTRKYKRSLETETDAYRIHGDSKSAVSRNFITMTAAKLEEWLKKPITEEYPILMMDGIVFQGTTVIIVLGIDKKGEKKTLGAWEGATENKKVCVDLLQNLVERGLKPEMVKLAIIDGGKALRSALNDIFGKGLYVQRCQVHKKKNVADYLPENMKDSIRGAMSEAYNVEKYETAKRMLENIARRIEKEYPAASRSLREGLEETLTLHKLRANRKLRKSLCTTNPIESLNSGIRRITGRVRRWRNSSMVMRWACGGIIESERNFRRLKGYQHLDAFFKNIDRCDKKVMEIKQVSA